MRVFCTQVLRQALAASGACPVAFSTAFGRWKSNWPEFEYKSELFGKDGAYRRPTLSEPKSELRHVHLTPAKNEDALKRWMRKLRLFSRKVSDRHLIYVKRPGTEDFLLVFILDEPDAHAVAEMKTEAHRSIMEGFAKVASEFVATGKVIA